ncbi:hypothetical protein [Streptomyces sannanensis]|uniref:hypothetical protein n=1 Tax=Streptomyces sannanensis TaxID=285536 RepID=UPI0031EDF3D9
MPYSCWPTRMRLVGFLKMVPFFFARPTSDHVQVVEFEGDWLAEPQPGHLPG